MKHNKTKQNKTIIHTFAILLALLYLIIRAHPAINAMPNSIPIKIPEIKPIFTDSKHHFFPFNTEKHKNPKFKTKNPHEKRTKKQIFNTQTCKTKSKASKKLNFT